MLDNLKPLAFKLGLRNVRKHEAWGCMLKEIHYLTHPRLLQLQAQRTTNKQLKYAICRSKIVVIWYEKIPQKCCNYDTLSFISS